MNATIEKTTETAAILTKKEMTEIAENFPLKNKKRQKLATRIIEDMAENSKYDVECAGNVVVGDVIRFDHFVSSICGWYSARKPKVEMKYSATYEAVVVADSYGEDKQQHTFSLFIFDGKGGTFLKTIKGRVLYRNAIMRKAWKNEADRAAAVKEKNGRGDYAREIRDERKAQAF